MLSNIATISNPSSIAITGIQANVLSAIPINISLHTSSLSPGNVTSISVKLSPPGTGYTNAIVTFNSGMFKCCLMSLDQGASVTMTLYFTIVPVEPNLQINPSSISRSVIQTGTPTCIVKK